MPRIKFTQPITRARAEELLGEVATLTLERNNQKIEMDRQLTAIRENYETSLSALGSQIEEKVALLEAWASANPDEFPKARKSIEMVHGVLGYRTGTPKLKTLLRKTWAVVLETVKSMPNLAAWVRVKEELNKEQIITDYQQGHVTDADLKQIGVKVEQDEAFFVDPKLEELANRATKEAA